METKTTNPKDAAAVDRLDLGLVPDTLEIVACPAFAEGDAKYRCYNWREAGVKARVYYAALKRHLKRWWNGEDRDPKTGVRHLSSAIACLAILEDARLCDKLTDDRPPPAPIWPAIEAASHDQNVVRAYVASQKKDPV